MKLITALLALAISGSAMSATLSGQVRKFTGMTVESRRSYSYIALETTDGQRLGLPSWVKAEKLLLVPHQLVIEGEVDSLSCIDMSRACKTGVISDIKSFGLGIGKRLTDAKSYTGRLVEFKGIGVTIRKPYNYIAIDSQNGALAVPFFLDAKELLKVEPNANYVLTGKVLAKACVDMSKACGPNEVSPLSAVSIKF
ncbi:MAG: hypothetical protein K2Q18_18360 [Bdellovibrionales bacterium]|nr:hypothetical protein [Bdellovibrionales bacterium]